MMNKCNEFVWSEAAEKASLALKSVLASRSVLRPPNFELPFGIAVDSSDRAISVVLFQVYDNLEHPVCYFSKLLNKHQRGYSTVEKEVMALRQAGLQFRVYFDSGSPITVYTDHSPFKYLNTMAKHNAKLLRWKLFLQAYDLRVNHRPEAKNLLPDILSRPSLVDMSTTCLAEQVSLRR